MKIEKVTFENINSLGGHFEVDFTHPSLADDGIFVISGPTGVGKTSLLDAISFALYGKTARQDAISNNVNELMTRGTLHCMAEVQFEKEGRRYVARSYQRRRRGRSEDAMPFAPIERGLFTLGEDGEVTPLGDQKVRSVNDGVEELTGLTFSNFYRCMMLAQGEFAKFLQANDKERSEVLATITGTEIYQQIGEVVHAHKAELERELDSQQRREVMTEEVRVATETARNEADATLQRLTVQQDTLAAAAAWLEDVAKATDLCTRSGEALLQAQAAVDDFRESGAEADWKMAEAAQAVAPSHAALEAALVALGHCSGIVERETKFLEQQTRVLQDAIADENSLKKTLDEESPVIQARIKHLREVIRPMEQAVALARQSATESAKACAQAQSREKTAKEALDATLARDTAAKAALAEAQAEHTAVQADAALAEYLPTLTARFRDWKSATRASGEAEDTAPATTADIHHRQAELVAVRDGILAGGTRAQLVARKEALTRLLDRQGAFTQAQAAASAAQAKVTQAQKAIAGLTPLEPAQQLVDSLTAARDSLQTCSSLEDQLAKLCHDFQTGTLESCPCCGSTVRPEHLPHPMSTHLVAAEKSLATAKDSLQALQREHEASQRLLSRAQGQAQSCAATLENAQSALSSALAEAGFSEPPADLPQLIGQASAGLAQLDAVEAELSALAVRLNLAEKRDAFLQELAPCSAATPGHVAAAAAVLNDLSTRRTAFAKKSEALQKATAAAALTSQKVTSDTAAHAAAQEAASKAGEEAATALANAQQLERKLLEERGEEPSATTEEKLRNRLDYLNRCYADYHAHTEKQRAIHAEHIPLLQAAEAKMPEAKQNANQARDAFHLAIADHCLGDIDQYAAARTKLPQLPELRRRAEALSTALTSAQSRAKLAQEQLEALQAKQLTPLTAEELQEQRLATETAQAAQRELMVQLLSRLQTDDEARDFNARLEAGLEGKRRELEEWSLLAEILGRSKDGFKRYAQKVTFDLLICHANVQLRALNDRYTLEQGEEQLSLYVRDRYQDDEARSCSNLSGGESFVVSLALALGLSRMSGRTRIDSLFLDEGFGTLDENTLTHVLNCLQTLRADGKQVGIISHVQRLKNEIRSSLELVPRAINGLSTFAPHPAVTAQAGDTIAPTAAAARQAETLATQRQAILSALAAGPSREKELRAATGILKGLRNILRDMVGEGLITYDGKLYALPEQ